MRSPQPMDSRIPSRDRAFAMVMALLRGADFDNQQLRAIKKALPKGKPGRARKTHCIRRHERTLATTDSSGHCTLCYRFLEGGRRCACGHPRHNHERGKECYHATDGVLDCECTRYVRKGRETQ